MSPLYAGSVPRVRGADRNQTQFLLSKSWRWNRRDRLINISLHLIPGSVERLYAESNLGRKAGGWERIEGKRKSISGEGNGFGVRSLDNGGWETKFESNWKVGFWHTKETDAGRLFRAN